MEYYDPWWKEYMSHITRIDFWTYFCHKKLKALREHTFQGKALTITTTNQQNSSADPSIIENFNFPGMISGSSRNFLLMLKRYIFRYVTRDLYKTSADPFVKEEEIDAKEAYGGSGSKKRRTNAVVKCED